MSKAGEKATAIAAPIADRDKAIAATRERTVAVLQQFDSTLQQIKTGNTSGKRLEAPTIIKDRGLGKTAGFNFGKSEEAIRKAAVDEASKQYEAIISKLQKQVLKASQSQGADSETYAKLQAALTTSEKDKKRYRNERDSYKTALEAIKATEKTLAEERDEARDQSTSLRTEITTLSAQVTTQASDIATLTDKLSQVQAKYDAATVELSQLRFKDRKDTRALEELTAFRKENARLEEQLKAKDAEARIARSLMEPLHKMLRDGAASSPEYAELVKQATEQEARRSAEREERAAEEKQRYDSLKEAYDAQTDELLALENKATLHFQNAEKRGQEVGRLEKHITLLTSDFTAQIQDLNKRHKAEITRKDALIDTLRIIRETPEPEGYPVVSKELEEALAALRAENATLRSENTTLKADNQSKDVTIVTLTQAKPAGFTETEEYKELEIQVLAQQTKYIDTIAELTEEVTGLREKNAKASPTAQAAELIEVKAENAELSSYVSRLTDAVDQGNTALTRMFKAAGVLLYQDGIVAKEEDIRAEIFSPAFDAQIEEYDEALKAKLSEKTTQQLVAERLAQFGFNDLATPDVTPVKSKVADIAITPSTPFSIGKGSRPATPSSEVRGRSLSVESTGADRSRTPSPMAK